HWASFLPRRTLVAETGSTVRLRVHNTLAGVHALSVPGVGSTGPIQPGATADLELSAPAPGTYLYLDPTNAPVERVLGLHGVLLVTPADDRWRLTGGGAEFERQWIWICQDVVPEWGRLAQQGRPIDRGSLPPAPRYFMLNDRSGFQSLAASKDEAVNLAAHEETLISGSPRRTDVRDLAKPDGAGSVVTGQLVRMVNTGLVVHQMHFHGNHVWTLRRNGQDFPRSGGRVDGDGHVVLQQYEDVVELDPLDRKEIVLPLRRPPEALNPVWAARRQDWHYPMHCHAEPSQTAAGGLYPGGLVADWVLAYPEPDARPVPHPTFASQTAFASGQPKEGSPATQFRQRPDRTFERQFFSTRMRLPDRSEHEFWSFQDPRGGRGLPAPLIRVTEGELVHVQLKPSKGPHTIHLHGMEPDPRNDGVGHTSFEVTGSYTYQWRPEPGVPGDPNVGTAGSFFYHCHVNTVLHVQMGMFGPLIVDPVAHPDFPAPPGTRRAFVDGPLYDVATELLLVPYSLDPRWHRLN
ncbi:MAG: multicopper oxidase domain-containing protein, partial [Nocardioidaceae bacterium]